MEIFTVSLFGHRYIADLRKLADRLFPMIKELMQTKPYVFFLSDEMVSLMKMRLLLLSMHKKSLEKKTTI